MAVLQKSWLNLNRLPPLPPLRGTGGQALHSLPVPAAQSRALRNPAYTPRKGGGNNIAPPPLRGRGWGEGAEVGGRKSLALAKAHWVSMTNRNQRRKNLRRYHAVKLFLGIAIDFQRGDDAFTLRLVFEPSQDGRCVDYPTPCSL
jgi:hypothetical protein